MLNRRQFVRQTVAALLACGLIVSLLPGFAAAQDLSTRETPSPGAPDSAPFVIFDDDFDSDSDGPMALCLLLELEAVGECKIIACGTSELHEDSTGAMATTLKYFGRGDIPLGSHRDELPEKKQSWE